MSSRDRTAAATTVAIDAPQEPSNVNKYLAFAFGVIFVSVLLWLLFRNEGTPLNEDQAKLVRIVSALAAAGVAAALPGTVQFRHRNLIRATGAVAIFILVFVYEPQRAVTPAGIWPHSDPSKVVEQHLRLIDAGRYEDAYAALSPEARKRFTPSEFVDAFKVGREPYGTVQSRTRPGIYAVASLPDGTTGPFKVYGYVTTFSNGTTANEPVWAMATGHDKWGVVFHNVFPCANNQCGLPPASITPTSSR